ncbi:D-aminoacyl-tRNA deacylase [Iodobacter ciconiae]|uniref:D-aminoacyl-tRNA deacylase n=1 Tax=Iodobacter ciconiae TaxID=2496266 RepID=A0A3S8ZUK4_9NEIS|nr:D-aminoacyl-tRNA deacylase [Iodobacter ciconiae]AZN37183.1 D-tyrosyl-tRNA(Tyr) deacylase [Iodobacter ciconiae]
MRVLIQRVKQASVAVDGEICGQIAAGLLLLVGIENSDSETDLNWTAKKICNLRIFEDEAQVMNRSVLDCQGEMLAVSQFTLFGSYNKGNRPSWGRAARGEISQPLFNAFVQKLAQLSAKPVPTGIFGADMQVELINDGPITLMLDSKNPE